MVIIIDLVPYPVEEKSGTITLPNKWGMDGIEWVKRKNPYNEPSGEFLEGRVSIEIEEETVSLKLRDGIELEDAVRHIEDYYSSVGWEFVTKPYEH